MLWIVAIVVPGICYGMEGGTDINMFQAPYQVQVEHAESSEFISSGAMLNCKWCVTTASAVYGYQPKNILIRSGIAMQSYSGGKHIVRQIIQHPHFKNNNNLLDNDIALIQIHNTFKYSCTNYKIGIAPTSLPIEILVDVTGWNAVEKKKQLQLLGMPKIYDHSLCKGQYSKTNKIIDKAICTDETFKNMKGNLLTYEGMLSGLFLSKEDGLPAVYTDVNQFSEWIMLTEKNNTIYNEKEEHCEDLSLEYIMFNCNFATNN